jgi:hypothetical protein
MFFFGWPIICGPGEIENDHQQVPGKPGTARDRRLQTIVAGGLGGLDAESEGEARR